MSASSSLDDGRHAVGVVAPIAADAAMDVVGRDDRQARLRARAPPPSRDRSPLARANADLLAGSRASRRSSRARSRSLPRAPGSRSARIASAAASPIKASASVPGAIAQQRSEQEVAQREAGRARDHVHGCERRQRQQPQREHRLSSRRRAAGGSAGRRGVRPVGGSSRGAGARRAHSRRPLRSAHRT